MSHADEDETVTHSAPGLGLATGVLLSLSILAFNAAWVSHRLGFVHRPREVKETDHRHYIEMARGAAGRAEFAQAPPYCYRVLTPWLAGRLARAGLGLNAAFYLITNLSLLGFLVSLWVLLGHLGFRPRDRIVGLLLVGLTQGPIRWFEYQYWMSDPLCLFLLALALVLAVRRRWAALAVVSVVAAFVRETYVLVYPFLLIVEWRRVGPWRALRRTVAIAALPLAVTIALRLLIQPNQPDDFVAGIADSMSFRGRHLLDNQLYVLGLGTWGVLLTLALLEPGRLWGAARRQLEWAALIAMAYATLVISNNTERPLAYAVPAMLPAALSGLERLAQRTRIPFASAAFVALSLQAGHFAVTRFGELGMSIYQPTHWGVIASNVVFWLAARGLVFLRGDTAGRRVSAPQ